MENNLILVIEIQDSVIDGVHLCDSSKEAEFKFIELCREKIPNFNERTFDDIEDILDNGYEKWGNNSICIHHLFLPNNTVS